MTNQDTCKKGLRKRPNISWKANIISLTQYHFTERSNSRDYHSPPTPPRLLRQSESYHLFGNLRGYLRAQTHTYMYIYVHTHASACLHEIRTYIEYAYIYNVCTIYTVHINNHTDTHIREVLT